MKTILWIYYRPLVPEAGGTERVTSLLMKGLSQRCYRCLGILEVKAREGVVEYKGETVTDIYDFLQENKVDIVINQLGQVKDMLHFFLSNGGSRWKEEGGRIISCLHFNPKPVSMYYNYMSKQHKSLRDHYVIIKSWLLYKRFEQEDLKRIGMTYRYIYDNSDAYVLLSESYRDYFEKSIGGARLEKLYSINNPLTFDDIADNSIFNHKKNVILVVSRMTDWHKRVSVSLKAWERISRLPQMEDWKLVLVGAGEDLENYKEYVSKYNIERVCFEGQQNPEPYYQVAKIFLMTSTITEGWGLTLTESLQRGVVPVVLDSTSVYHDMIKDGYNGFLVEENDINGFRNRIVELATKPVVWRKMAESGLKSAERFTLDATIDKWEKIL